MIKNIVGVEAVFHEVADVDPSGSVSKLAFAILPAIGPPGEFTSTIPVASATTFAFVPAPSAAGVPCTHAVVVRRSSRARTRKKCALSASPINVCVSAASGPLLWGAVNAASVAVWASELAMDVAHATVFSVPPVNGGSGAMTGAALNTLCVTVSAVLPCAVLVFVNASAPS